MAASQVTPAISGKPIPRAGWRQALAWATHFRNHARELTEKSYERYGPIVLQESALMTAVQIFGPEANRFVLLDRENAFSAKRSWDLIMGRIFGGGLLLRDGDDHRHHRKIMQDAFKTGVLDSYSELMNPRIERGIAGWPASGGTLEAFPAFKKLTLDLAFEVFVGERLGDQTARIHRAFEDTVAAAMSLVRLPIPGLEFQRGLEGRRFMNGIFASLIPTRRAGQEADMLSRLCRAESEDGRRYTDQEIVDHMIFLMMAAHDTTTSSLTSLTYLLAKHPQWQERAREESLALDADHLAFEDQHKLESLTRCMHETLRLYPPLSTIPRVTLRDVEFDGYVIPEGAMVSIFPIHTHRMKEWWTDPDGFDPDRFSPARAEHRRHTHLYIPFGGGEHMCLGLRFAEMQILSVMHQLLRRTRWEVPDGYEMPVQEAPISKPRDGLPILLSSLA